MPLTKQLNYQVSFKRKFDNIPDANKYMGYIMEKHRTGHKLEITYYTPQPKYKSWVPLWLINLITIKTEYHGRQS